MNKYTIKNLQKEFGTEDKCLEYIFRTRFPDSKGFYKAAKTKHYTHYLGDKHIHPMAGTIFEKSSTPLTLWFHAIFLFSTSKNGVSAKELQRQLGVTYKCAWRMSSKIRSLMKQGGTPLSGIVEADETYLNGRQIPVAGVLKRDGEIRATTLPNLKEESIEPFLKKNVRKNARLMTDNGRVYQTVDYHFNRSVIDKSNEGHARGNVHVNTIEGFWSQVKRPITGTHRYISPKHAQSYLDFFAFQHANRASSVPLFLVLLRRACQ